MDSSRGDTGPAAEPPADAARDAASDGADATTSDATDAVASDATDAAASDGSDAIIDGASDVPLDAAGETADATPNDVGAVDVDRPICGGLGKVEDPRGCSGTSICDGAGNCVSRYTVFPITRRTPGNQASLTRITTGPDGNLWFNDSVNFGRMTVTGTSLEFPTAGSLVDLTSGPDGNIWVVDGSVKSIGRASPADGALQMFPHTAGHPTFPTGIVAGPDGNLWFCDLKAIGQITVAGAVTEFPVPSGDPYVVWIVVGADGNLWFTEETKGMIGRITTAGVITEFPAVPQQTASTSLLFHIAAAPDGNLWFIEPAPNKIGRITLAGAVTDFLVPTPNADLSDLTVAPDGNIWFIERFTRKLGRMTPSGTFTELPLPLANATIGAITMGPDGAVWITLQELLGNGFGPGAWLVRVQP